MANLQVTSNAQTPKRGRQPAARREQRPLAQQRGAVVGDLAIVANENVVRIVCVTEVADTHLVAVLCSNETEMASGRDVILRRDGTYNLLLEAECCLVILPSQVQEIVGTVNLEAVGAIRESLFTDGKSVESLSLRSDYETGSPLGGIYDPRWAFMERELDDATILRNLAHKAIFDDGWNPGYTGS